ncbi:uncharacterized protein [Anabrus simplex]|uniref:uncharacterized protein n=1 Tax=Anabrus simplex TaxID=316456 RepID=UPI0035A2BFB6
MDRLCRLCTGNVLSMEFLDLLENIDLMEKVEKHLQIKCSQDEFALPHKICNTCIYELEAFVNFFERCHSVQKALKLQAELYSDQGTHKSLFKGKKIDTNCHASNNIDGNGVIVSTVPNQTPLLNQLVRCIKSEEPSDTCVNNNLPPSEIVAKVIVPNIVKEEEKGDEEVFIIDASDHDSNDFRHDVIDVDDDSDVQVLAEQGTSEQSNKSEGVVNSSANKAEGIRNSSEGCNQPPGGAFQLNKAVINNLVHSNKNRNKSLPNSGSRPSNTLACDDSLQVTRSSIGNKQAFVSNTSSESHENVEKDPPSNSCRKKKRRKRSSSSSPDAGDGFLEGSRTEIVPSHKCGVCDRAFKRKVQLDVHLKTHSTKKTSDDEEESDVHESSSGSEFSCGEENSKSTKTSELSEHAQKQQQKETAEKVSSSLGFDRHQNKVLIASQHSKHQNRVNKPFATEKQSFQPILPFPVAKPVGVQSELKNSQVSQNSNKPHQTKSILLESLLKQPQPQPQPQPQVLVRFIPASSSQSNQYQSSPVSQVITTPHQVTSSSPQVSQVQNTDGVVLIGPFPSLPTFQVVQSLIQSQLAEQTQKSQTIADVSSSQRLKSVPVTSSSASLHDSQKNQSSQICQVALPLSSSTSPQISQQSCGTSVVQVSQTTPHLQKQFPASHPLQMVLNNCLSSASEQTAQITQVVPQQTACVMPSTSQSHVSQQGNIIALSPHLQTHPVSHTSMKTSQSSVQSSQIVPSTVQSQIIYIGQSSVQSQLTYQSQHPEIVHVLPSSQWTSSSTQSQGSQKSCNSQILGAVSTVPYSSSIQSQLFLPSTQPKIVVASSHQQFLQVQEHNVGQQHQHVQPSYTISKTTKSREDQPIVSCTPASLQFQDPKMYPLIPTSQPVQQPLVSCIPVFQQQSQISRSFQQSQIMPIFQSVQNLQPLQISQPSNSQGYPENHTTSLHQLTQPSQKIQDNNNGKSESSLQSLVPERSDLKQTMKSLQSEVGQSSPKHQDKSSRNETELLCMEVEESDSDNDMS